MLYFESVVLRAFYLKNVKIPRVGNTYPTKSSLRNIVMGRLPRDRSTEHKESLDSWAAQSVLPANLLKAVRNRWSKDAKLWRWLEFLQLRKHNLHEQDGVWELRQTFSGTNAPPISRKKDSKRSFTGGKHKTQATGSGQRNESSPAEMLRRLGPPAFLCLRAAAATATTTS